MIEFRINAQPDDESCGPTCLHSIYSHYGLDITYDQVVAEVERSLSGGTLAPFLGKHALQNGFKVTLYVNNLQLYDPTWFNEDGSSDVNVLREKLKEQMRFKRNRFLAQGTHSVLDFLTLGGSIRFQTLTAELLMHYFELGIPVLTGLSSTYLYNSSRELFKDGKSVLDDIRGNVCGHFVVLCGFDKNNQIVVADPFRENPVSGNHYYTVTCERLINAILLGITTFDGNLLIIEPQTAL
ncbi:peptidase-C39 like family protein [Legionella sp. CNM-4043-24]|uniref:peptidase-C39 like family protein n=1 Tax=Legionella sp. CNM-4043-24 TaxID=3421646 RepID=UPI00403AF141